MPPFERRPESGACKVHCNAVIHVFQLKAAASCGESDIPPRRELYRELLLLGLPGHSTEGRPSKDPGANGAFWALGASGNKLSRETLLMSINSPKLPTCKLANLTPNPTPEACQCELNGLQDKH